MSPGAVSLDHLQSNNDSKRGITLASGIGRINTMDCTPPFVYVPLDKTIVYYRVMFFLLCRHVRRIDYPKQGLMAYLARVFTGCPDLEHISPHTCLA
jgi:hypothetical protein